VLETREQDEAELAEKSRPRQSRSGSLIAEGIRPSPESAAMKVN
jgi:hypothetical protein